MLFLIDRCSQVRWVTLLISCKLKELYSLNMHNVFWCRSDHPFLHMTSRKMVWSVNGIVFGCMFGSWYLLNSISLEPTILQIYSRLLALPTYQKLIKKHASFSRRAPSKFDFFKKLPSSRSQITTRPIEDRHQFWCVDRLLPIFL